LTSPRQAKQLVSLTTDRIVSELLEETLEQIVTVGGSVIAVNATHNPEQSPRVRRLMGDLLALIQENEGDLGTDAPS